MSLGQFLWYNYQWYHFGKVVQLSFSWKEKKLIKKLFSLNLGCMKKTLKEKLPALKCWFPKNVSSKSNIIWTKVRSYTWPFVCQKSYLILHGKVLKYIVFEHPNFAKFSTYQKFKLASNYWYRYHLHQQINPYYDFFVLSKLA